MKEHRQGGTFRRSGSPLSHCRYLAIRHFSYELGESSLGFTLAASHCPVDVAGLPVTASTRRKP